LPGGWFQLGVGFGERELLVGLSLMGASSSQGKQSKIVVYSQP